MSERYDAIVIGAGISGETCAYRLRHAGMRVALVERDHIGGACSYWAVIPSTTLFGPANRRWRAQQLAGVASPAVAWPRSLISPETLLAYLQEAAQVETIQREGGTFVLGEAQLLGDTGLVEVGGRQLASAHIVVATGAEPLIPPIDGLATAECWTAREATTCEAIPESIVILGGGAQAIELAQMFRLYGANVTLVTAHNRLLHEEDPEVGALLVESLHQQGIRILLGRTATSVARDHARLCTMTLDDGTYVLGQEVVVASGHMPRTQGLGLEQTRVQFGPHGINVNEHCQAAEGIWAIGQVTGIAPLSHLAQYQARIAADAILGRAHPADYRAVPRIIFTDPQVAATGLTRAQLNEQHYQDVASVTVDLTNKRPFPYPLPRPAGAPSQFTLHADRSSGVLVGAWAVAPEAGEWIELARLAIHAKIPLAMLLDTLEQLPQFGEAYLAALDQLLSEIRPSLPGGDWI